MNGPPQWQGSATDYLAQNPPQQGPETLGQVVDTAQGNGDLMSRYQQALQLTQRVVMPAMQQEMAPPPQGTVGGVLNWLADIPTFGMRHLAERDYRQAYNAGIQQKNAALQLQAGKMALDVVNDQEQAARAGLQQQIALLNLDARIKGLDIQQQLAEVRANKAKLDEARARTSPMLTPGQLESADAMGLEPELSPELPGRVVLKKKPGGGYMSPVAGTPAAKALEAVGVGGETAGAVSPDASPAEKLRQRRIEIERKKQIQTTETKALPAEAGQVARGLVSVKRVIDQLYAEFSDPKERAQFVGVVRNPMMRGAQFFRANKRFARFMSLAKQIEKAKFDLGGKQLTGIEQSIVNQFIPTTTETGGLTEFDAKAKAYGENLPKMLDELLKVQGAGPETTKRIKDLMKTDSAPSPAPSGTQRRLSLDEFLAE